MCRRRVVTRDGSVCATVRGYSCFFCYYYKGDCKSSGFCVGCSARVEASIIAGVGSRIRIKAGIAHDSAAIGFGSTFVTGSLSTCCATCSPG